MCLHAGVIVCDIISPLVQHDCFALLCKVNVYSSSSSAKSLCHTALLSLPPPPRSLSHHRLSHLLYVLMAERDQGQLWLVFSMQGILWKQYITGNSCQSIPPSICVSSPPSRASTTCSNSFFTQLLNPVGMWVNVNLMVCHRGISLLSRGKL